MNDDELLAALNTPAARHTVEQHIGSGDWFVYDHRRGCEIFTESGFDGKQRCIAVARALNKAEGAA